MNASFQQLLTPTASATPVRLASLAAAGVSHLVLGWFFAATPVELPTIPVTEVALEPVTLPEPEPEPEPESPPQPAAAAPPPAPRPQRAAKPPAPAQAGTLITAREPTTPEPTEPVRFVTDPNGRSFGTGIVARGGSAQHGEAPTLPLPAAGGLRITPADRLRRAPQLAGDGCRGYFPPHAQRDSGSVSLVATVLPNGSIARLDIQAETPLGEGFAAAARACLGQRKFVPALDEHGEPTAARTRINLHFTR
ncbi:MAG TPA: energy transducer TonB [Polyangiales bacterium]|nr:energy transducer TonB [Polyangiales bacterium]